MTAVAQLLAHVPRLFLWILSKRRLRNQERELFLRIVQPGTTVFDVGANVGDYTRLFSILVGARGVVHAFEPIAETHRLLTRVAGGRSNVRLHQLAAGDTAGTREMSVVEGDFGQASLAGDDTRARGAAPSTRTFRVQVVTLDTMMDIGDLPAPAFIKIDVEGAERMVLRGARAMIATHQPVLFFEVFSDWTRRFGYTPLDLLRDVETLGYTESYLLNGTLRRLPPSGDMSVWPEAGSANVLALPHTPLGARTRLRITPMLGESRAVVV